MSKLGHTRDKIYKTISRQLHGVVPCWVCGQHVTRESATLEHIQPLSEGGNSHADNLAISHEVCNGQRHALGQVPVSNESPGRVQRRAPLTPLTPLTSLPSSRLVTQPGPPRP